jgi:hypothetical protein
LPSTYPHDWASDNAAVPDSCQREDQKRRKRAPDALLLDGAGGPPSPLELLPQSLSFLVFPGHAAAREVRAGEHPSPEKLPYFSRSNDLQPELIASIDVDKMCFIAPNP